MSSADGERSDPFGSELGTEEMHNQGITLNQLAITSFDSLSLT